MGRWVSIPACAAAVAAIACAALFGSGVAAAKPAREFGFGQRVLQTGTRGRDVRVLQKYLTKLSHPTPVDGAFGKVTSKSVKSLERERGWPVDGRVNKAEARRIRALLTRPSGLYFAYGLTRPAVTLTAGKPGSASVEVVDASGATVAALSASFSGVESQTVSWNGVASSGAYAPDGTYSFRLGAGNTANALISGGQVRPFLLRQHVFPIAGAHGYGGAGSRFGAPRPGHTHQGQDVSAACGEKLYVAEGGLLRVNSFQANGAGYYVVFHGAITGTDYVYMHMQKPSWAAAGQIIYAGQQIGKTGNTGSSEGCHLHFEHWTYPGWYLGGYPYDPIYELQAWDAYS